MKLVGKSDTKFNVNFEKVQALPYEESLKHYQDEAFSHKSNDDKPVKIRTVKEKAEKNELPDHIRLLLKDLLMWVLSLSKRWATKRLLVQILLDYFDIH